MLISYKLQSFCRSQFKTSRLLKERLCCWWTGYLLISSNCHETGPLLATLDGVVLFPRIVWRKQYPSRLPTRESPLKDLRVMSKLQDDNQNYLYITSSPVLPSLGAEGCIRQCRQFTCSDVDCRTSVACPSILCELVSFMCVLTNSTQFNVADTNVIKHFDIPILLQYCHFPCIMINSGFFKCGNYSQPRSCCIWKRGNIQRFFFFCSLTLWSDITLNCKCLLGNECLYEIF